MTLDEWKQVQEQERAKASFELRKAGEGEKKGMWKDTKVFKRSNDEYEAQYAATRVSCQQAHSPVCTPYSFYRASWEKLQYKVNFSHF